MGSSRACRSQQGDGPIVAVAGLGESPAGPDQVGEAGEGKGQVVAVARDLRTVVSQLLVDLQSPTEFGLALRWPARLRQQAAEAAVDVRQSGAEFGDSGVVGGQLLQDLLRPAELGLRL